MGRFDFIYKPFWAHRQERFGGNGNYGASADSASPDVSQKIEADGQRVGIFRLKIFIQNSRLWLDMGEERSFVNDNFPRDATGIVIERILTRQEDAGVVVRGEPFI